MKSKVFPRVMVILIFIMAQLMIFSLPSYAQKSSNFSNSVNKKANTLRLMAANSNKSESLEITDLSDSSKNGLAFIKLPKEKDPKIVRGLKYINSVNTLGFLGIIESYSTREGFVPVGVMVVITPDNGVWEVTYEIYDSKTVYEEGSFPFTGVKFYDALEEEKGSLFATSSAQMAYDALLKWADKHLMKFKE